MQRRKFIEKSILSLGALSLLPDSLIAEPRTVAKMKANRLQAGDKVGVITPGSALSLEDFQKALDNIRSLGLIPVPAQYANQKYGFLGGTDFQRLSDLHEVFQNNDLKGVFCARGGYGTARIINHIDYTLIRSNPKVLIGFSDITALLNAIYRETGMISFHGPVGASEFTDFTKSEFQQIVMNGSLLSLTAEGGYTIKSGSAKGKLVGGNLSLIAALVGTKYEINFKNKIAFIEEVGESPYRIDRMLTQLLDSGSLKYAKGIAFGQFADCDVDLDDPDYATKFTLKQVLTDRCSRLNMPVFYGFKIGHVADNATIPIGITGLLDADNGKLESTDSAVR